MQHKNFHFGAIALAVAALTACGGGGGSAPVSSTVPTLSGTAAVGAPLPNAVVTLKDANGKELTTTADANGAYTFADVTGVLAPIMLQATGTAGGTAYTLYSMASTVSTDKGVSGVVNITPVTDSVVSQTLGATSAQSVFGDAAKIKAVDATRLADAKGKLTLALKEVLSALGQDPTKVDLFTTRFEANNTGLDKLLDMVQLQTVPTASGAPDIRVADKSTGQAVTLRSTDNAAAVAALPKPSEALVALNTATVKNLLASFNALTGSKADLQSAAMKDLFDPDFLDQGQNRDKVLANFWVSDTNNFIGGKMLDYVLGGVMQPAKSARATSRYKDLTAARNSSQCPSNKAVMADGGPMATARNSSLTSSPWRKRITRSAMAVRP